MRCPNCELINPKTAQRCDCGYDFADDRVQASYVEAARARRGEVASDQQQVDRLVRYAIIFAFFSLLGVGCVISMVCGVRALHLIRDSRKPLRGETAATVCVALSALELVISLFWIARWFVPPK